MKNFRLNSFKERIGQNSLLRPLDILLVGATGVGKSSTINALFGSEIAKVGYGVDPETQHIKGYSLHGYLKIHDSAGLGDGKEADNRHAVNIINKLYKKNSDDNLLIDLALVTLDGSSRDMGTTFNLLEQAVLPNIDPDRVIVAINQADMLMKGTNWDTELNKPNNELLSLLEEKAISVQKRIQESTGLTVKKPVYYSARHNYNLDALFDHIICHIPTQRRLVVKKVINKVAGNALLEAKAQYWGSNYTRGQ